MAQARRRPLARPATARRVDSAPMMKKLSSRGWSIGGYGSALAGFFVTIVVGCGGKVVVDAAEVGGAGGTGQGGSGLSTSNASVSSSVSTSVGSSGQPSPCDLTSSCETCVNCSVDMVCPEQWGKCASTPQCLDLMYCLASCQNEQLCVDKCLSAYPGGVDAYNETALCVVCQACANDCEGLTKNCP